MQDTKFIKNYSKNSLNSRKTSKILKITLKFNFNRKISEKSNKNQLTELPIFVHGDLSDYKNLQYQNYFKVNLFLYRKIGDNGGYKKFLNCYDSKNLG